MTIDTLKRDIERIVPDLQPYTINGTGDGDRSQVRAHLLELFLEEQVETLTKIADIFYKSPDDIPGAHIATFMLDAAEGMIEEAKAAIPGAGKEHE